MGLFNLRKNRVYSLTEAKRLLQTEKYDKYMAVEVDEKNQTYRLVPEEEALKDIRKERQQERQQEIQTAKKHQMEFRDQLSGSGMYRNMQTSQAPKNYNNYQAAKRYEKYLRENESR